MKAFIISMQITCMVELYIEWCLMSWWVYLSDENKWWRNQSKSNQMGEIIQHIWHVQILHRVWYPITHTTPWQIQWPAIFSNTEGRYVFRWNQEIWWKEQYHRQSERIEYTKTHIWSCTSLKVSCSLLSPAIGHSLGISGHSHSSHYLIQTSSIHIRICENAEWETSDVQNHCGEEPL